MLNKAMAPTVLLYTKRLGTSFCAAGSTLSGNTALVVDFPPFTAGVFALAASDERWKANSSEFVTGAVVTSREDMKELRSVRAFGQQTTSISGQTTSRRRLQKSQINDN